MIESDMVLGIEGGGSRTTVLAVDGAGRVVGRASYGPGNIRLLDDSALAELLGAIHRDFPHAAAIGLGAAGLSDPRELTRVGARLTNLWPGVPHQLGTDLDTALLAEGPIPKTGRMIVISGTGSCCCGETSAGFRERMGGWGHLLGDKGSGYEIGLRALKAVVYYWDRDGDWTHLGQNLLRELLLNEPKDLISWVQNASKSAVAGLAPVVFASAKARDSIARDILEGAVDSLARDAAACLKKLGQLKGPIEINLVGGVFQAQPEFAAKVKRALHLLAPKACFKAVTRESAWGAVELARKVLAPGVTVPAVGIQARVAATKSPQLSSTEERNPRSMNLDRLSIPAAIELMSSEDQFVTQAVLAQKAPIAKAVTMVSAALKKGGRLFYVGAGSSGRLGVLDASECPPTFRSDPNQVQGIMAGGYEALWRSKEGAEDDAAAGAQAVHFRGVRAADVVIGIAASGRTPFVWGALVAARQKKARVVLIDFNPNFKLAPQQKLDLRITPAVGPEILTGSTRLKAGTATKMVLNMITTLAMVRLGKVKQNLMIDLNPSNVKLKDRAIRIVVQLTGCQPAQAQAALQASGWVIKAALQRLPKLSA